MQQLRQQGFTEQTSNELNTIVHTLNAIQQQMARMKQYQHSQSRSMQQTPQSAGSGPMPGYSGGQPQQPLQHQQQMSMNGMPQPPNSAPRGQQQQQQQQMQMPMPPAQMQPQRMSPLLGVLLPVRILI